MNQKSKYTRFNHNSIIFTANVFAIPVSSGSYVQMLKYSNGENVCSDYELFLALPLIAFQWGLSSITTSYSHVFLFMTTDI